MKMLVGLLLFFSPAFALAEGLDVYRGLHEQLPAELVPNKSVLPLAARSELAVVISPTVMQSLYDYSYLAYVAVYKNDSFYAEKIVMPMLDYKHSIDRLELVGGDVYTVSAYPLPGCIAGANTQVNDPCVDEARTKTETETLPLSSSFTVASGGSPVLFIPGILGSRLAYVDTNGLEKALWETLAPSTIRSLGFTGGGKPLTPNVYATEVVDSPFELSIEGISAYKPFMNYLDTLVTSGTISSWQPLPYDWREDVRDIAKRGILQRDGSRKSLAKTIQTMASSSPSGRVTLIAHSNGGLVAKALVKELERQKKGSLIDEMILVGSPQLGTPAALGTLFHGDLVPGKIDRPWQGVFRTSSITMPGTYGLIPSRAYLDRVRSNLIRLNSSPDSVYESAFGATVNSWSELSRFLIGNGLRSKPNESDLATPTILSSRLVSQANSLHQELDSWIPATPTIRVTEIAGYGIQTIQQLAYDIDEQYKCTGVITRMCKLHTTFSPYAITSNLGDGTVNSFSAVAIEKEAIFVDLVEAGSNVDHNKMLGTPIIQRVVKNLLERRYSEEVGTRRTRPNEIGSSITIAMHSPADILLVDQNGNRTGLITNTDGTITVEENIPGSSYTEMGESKFIFAPSSPNYTLNLNGTGYGVFTLEVITTEGDTSTIKRYRDVPVTPETSGALVIQHSAPSPLSITTDNLTSAVEVDTPPTRISALEGFQNLLTESSIPQRTRRLFENRLSAYRLISENPKYERARKRIILTLKQSIAAGVGRTIDENTANQMLELLEYL